MRSRIALSGGVAAALVSGLLIGTAPSASADIGDKKSFPLPSGFKPGGITLSASGDLWFSPDGGTELVSMSPTGEVARHPLSVISKPVKGQGITQGRDGRIWFAESTNGALIFTDASGNDSKQVFPSDAKNPPRPVVLGSDGNIWFGTSKTIGRLVPGDGSVNFASLNTEISDLAAGPGNLVFFTTKAGVAGVVSTDLQGPTKVPLPGAAKVVAVADDGTVWAGAAGSKVYRVTTGGDVSTFPLGSIYPTTGIAVAPDGSAWVTDSDGQVYRVAANSTTKHFPIGSLARGIALGADGNMWVASSNSVTRFLTGITPVSTTAPAISGPANGSGAALSADNGTWKYRPTSFDQQWQRCTANDPASCADIGGATKAAYTITDADLGGWLRVTVTAKNLNGAAKPVDSALFAVAAKPTAPTPTQPTTPTGPAPVTAVGKATVAAGITASLSAPSSTLRTVKRTYAVRFTSPTPRGTVAFSLVNAAGVQAHVLNPGKAVTKKGKKATHATVTTRIPRSVPKGAYTLVAVYTPSAKQAATYPVTTLTRPITIR